jgi:hypothetical protein
MKVRSESQPDPGLFTTKGQLISEWIFGVFNFPKKQHKIWWISALESKKWSNQKDKGTLLCWIAPYS